MKIVPSAWTWTLSHEISHSKEGLRSRNVAKSVKAPSSVIVRTAEVSRVAPEDPAGAGPKSA